MPRATHLPAVSNGYIATDGAYLYGWTKHGELAKVSTTGGTSTILPATNWTLASPIVVDDFNVYWTNVFDGTVLKISK